MYPLMVYRTQDNMITFEQIIKKSEDIVQYPIFRDSELISHIYKTYLKGYEPLTYDGIFKEITVANVSHYGRRPTDGSTSIYSVIRFKGEVCALLSTHWRDYDKWDSISIRYHIINDDVFDNMILHVRKHSTLHDVDDCIVDANDSIFKDLYESEDVGVYYINGKRI